MVDVWPRGSGITQAREAGCRAEVCKQDEMETLTREPVGVRSPSSLREAWGGVAEPTEPGRIERQASTAAISAWM